MKKLLILLLTVPLLYSCIQTSTPNIPRRVNFQFNVSNVGNTIESNGDSIKVSEIKLFAEEYNTMFADSAILQTSIDGLIMAYSSDMGTDDNLILGTNIGYRNINNFNGFQLVVNPPEEDDNIQDREFFGNETNYSVIIKGKYNGASFNYKSNVSYNRIFSYQPVELTDKEQTLVIRMLMDSKEILIDDSDTILDPRKSENKAAIDSLVSTTMKVKAFSANRSL